MKQISENQNSAETKNKLLSILWTITSVTSVLINIIIAFIIGFILSNNTIQDLYDDFQLMDQAHIKTNVVVDDMMPVKFELKLKQDTNVVLSKDVTIKGAHVSVRTTLIDITNAPATVVLPAGTSLPITLNLVVPVDQTIPIQLNVPVDIAIEETELHTPLVGFKKIIQPFYCFLFPKAVTLDGDVICP
ncbi:MAG: hypothetical protein KZQ83_19710 [gamma proteobacterium symbiont of Taylorina sp.]|nr:hypothetical protein [gamma proteobacterium symbiont of Taylorina sp.]